MLKEFKNFALKGNVIDLAVGVIIGAAFGKVVSSLVNDILMPPIALILGNVDFSNMFITLSGEKYATLASAKEAGAVTLNYGLFLNTIIDFLVIAICIFLLIRQMNKLEKEDTEEKTLPARTCPFCFTEIAPKATRCPACTSTIE